MNEKKLLRVFGGGNVCEGSYKLRQIRPVADYQEVAGCSKIPEEAFNLPFLHSFSYSQISTFFHWKYPLSAPIFALMLQLMEISLG